MKNRKRIGEVFINHLEKLAGVNSDKSSDSKSENRAALANLRRGLGKEAGAAWESYSLVMRFVPHGASRTTEEAFFNVAALFGLFPSASWRTNDEKRPTNFGASLGWLKSKNPDSDSVERRFVALLNADREDLPTHLRHAVNLLKTADLPIDWNDLLKDLIYWDSPNRNVQRRWSRAFWGAETIVTDLTSENSASKNQN